MSETSETSETSDVGDVGDVEIVRSHQERVTVRVGETYVKVNAQGWRTRREVAAIAHAGVPVPAVMWEQPNVVGLRSVGGEPLGLAGEESTASPAAWRAAGAVAHRIHSRPIPAWSAWTSEQYRDHLDARTRWLIDADVTAESDVVAMRAQAEVVLRPFVPAFVHGDLQPEHVFVDGDEVVGVIDWEDAEAGDPHFDIAVLTMGHSEHLDDVLSGYGAPLDLGIVRGWWAFRRITALCWWIEHGFDPTGDIEAFQRHARAR